MEAALPRIRATTVGVSRRNRHRYSVPYEFRRPNAERAPVPWVATQTSTAFSLFGQPICFMPYRKN